MRYKNLNFPIFEDPRGSLLACDQKDLPFQPRRVFFIYGVPRGKARAEHAVSCDLILLVLKGSVSLSLGEDACELKQLSAGGAGVLVKRHTFLTLYNFSEDAMLAILASAAYKDTDYFSNGED